MSRPSWKKLVLGVSGGGVLGVVALGGVGYALTDVPKPSATSTQQATIITYSDGSELGRVGSLNRKAVPLTAVSDAGQKAVLAAEDRGFYSEPGISPRGIARALFTNVRGGGDIQQGGSTITQQYAKNAFLTSERTYTRKVKEVFIALKMSQTRSKPQILEDYLNTIYFGRGAYGIEAATETYFGGHARDLSPSQAAVLASSVRSPAAYDPKRHPEAAKGRWAYVLDGMVKKGWLTPEQRAAARYPNVRDPKAVTQQDRSGPKGYVIDQVEEELARLGGFSEAQLAQGGLIVKTTLRRQAQEAAERAVPAEVPDAKAVVDPSCTRGKQACLDEANNALIQGALVAVKPGTGEVWAYYGGRSGNGGFDYASHEHPQDPGSTMKPYVLATALDQGISLRTRFSGNSPKEFDGYPVPVSNFGDEDYGRIDLVTATENSVNTVYTALAQQVGPKKVAEMAHKAGIGSDVRLADAEGNTALGIALGIYGVPVIDQASGFSTFAAGGVSTQPFFVKSVRRQGSKDVVYNAKIIDKHRAFSEDVAADADYALQQVVRSGTASANGRLADGRPAAGKTGTTQESNDAWMVGFTPQLSAAVWIGRGNNKPIVGELGSPRGLTGGSAPARIWKAFMDGALAGMPQEEFPPRADVGRATSGSGSGSDSSVREDSGDDGTTRTRRPRTRRTYQPDTVETVAPTQDAPEPTTAPTRSRPTRSPRPAATQEPPPQEPTQAPPQESPPPPPDLPGPSPTG